MHKLIISETVKYSMDPALLLFPISGLERRLVVPIQILTLSCHYFLEKGLSLNPLLGRKASISDSDQDRLGKESHVIKAFMLRLFIDSVRQTGLNRARNNINNIFPYKSLAVPSYQITTIKQLMLRAVNRP